jgi:hypothetical protein
MDVPRIMDVLNVHTTTLVRMTGSSPTLYIKRVFGEVLDGLRSCKEDEDILQVLAKLRRRIEKLNKLRDQVVHLERDLLSLDEFGEEVAIVQNTVRRISHIISCLEDLSRQSSVGLEELRSAYYDDSGLTSQPEPEEVQ